MDYTPNMQIHGMQYFDSNLYELVQVGDAGGFGMVQKIYETVLREDTTSQATRDAWNRYQTTVKGQLTREMKKHLLQEFNRLLDIDKERYRG